MSLVCLRVSTEDVLLPSDEPVCHSVGARGSQDFYFEKIRVFKAGLCLNIAAWNNKIGLWSYFVGFEDRSNG